MSSAPPILTVDRLCIAMGGQMLLHDITFHLGRGERVGLLGQSGSGKSLTAAAALGLTPPDARVTGRIGLNGIDVTATHVLSRPRQARAAMVTQDTQAALNPLATIGYQLERPLRRRGLSRRAAREQALVLLDRVGLPDPGQMLRRCSPELSGGQRQRVCIAMALAADAPLIIADEPTTALDVITQAQVLRVLDDVTRAPGGPGLLFITHDLHAAAHLCDRALVIERGRIIEDGPMRRLLAAPQTDYARMLVAAAQRCGIQCQAVHG